MADLSQERAAFVRTQLLIMVLLAAALSALMVLSGNLRGAVVFAISGLVGGGLMLWTEARLTGWNIHGTSAVLFGTVSFLAVANGGGIGAPVLVALPLVPVLAFFSGGVRAGLGWLAVSAATPLALAIAEPWIGAPTLSPEVMFRLSVLAPVMSSLSLAAYVWQHEKFARRREILLRSSRLKAEAASEAKSTFLATMSHEIRTPLGGILGLTQLLQEEPLSSQQAEMVRLLDRSAQSLLAQVDQILDISRIEAGRLELEAIAFSPAAVASEVVALNLAAADQAGLALTMETAAGLPLWLRGDPLRFRQIVQNLVGNALKFTHNGQVQVRLEAADGGLRLTVEDTGIGIDPAIVARLLEPFEQADEGTARRFGGSGLGLSIVSRLAVAMDGTLEIDSTPGEGSRFAVTMRLPEAEPPDTGAHGTPPLTPLQLRVLLVDDNAINRTVFSKLLQRLGCTVSIAEDGPRAVAATASSAPELILMDIDMPGMDGIEATRLILSAQHIPIIALTASATAEVRAAAQAAGTVDFLTRPLTLMQLHAALSRHAGG
jgi:signal transduction histidine kinase